MLGGRISNQDEDEVEDELEAMEAELAGVPLPEVPTSGLPPKVRADAVGAQAKQQEKEEGRVAMLA
jgi:charged multivesicular body protein 6